MVIVVTIRDEDIVFEGGEDGRHFLKIGFSCWRISIHKSLLYYLFNLYCRLRCQASNPLFQSGFVNCSDLVNYNPTFFPANYNRYPCWIISGSRCQWGNNYGADIGIYFIR